MGHIFGMHLARSHWLQCQPGAPEPRLSASHNSQKYKYVADPAAMGRQRNAWSAWCNLRQLAPEALRRNLHDLDPLSSIVNPHRNHKASAFSLQTLVVWQVQNLPANGV